MAKRQPPLKVGANYNIGGRTEDVRLKLIGRAVIRSKEVLLFEVVSFQRKGDDDGTLTL